MISGTLAIISLLQGSIGLRPSCNMECIASIEIKCAKSIEANLVAVLPAILPAGICPSSRAIAANGPGRIKSPASPTCQSRQTRADPPPLGRALTLGEARVAVTAIKQNTSYIRSTANSRIIGIRSSSKVTEALRSGPDHRFCKRLYSLLVRAFSVPADGSSATEVISVSKPGRFSGIALVCDLYSKECGVWAEAQGEILGYSTVVENRDVRSLKVLARRHGFRCQLEVWLRSGSGKNIGVVNGAILMRGERSDNYFEDQ